jgi:CBS domain-containing protein
MTLVTVKTTDPLPQEIDMAKTARDVMNTKVRTVSPDVPLIDLDKLFIENRVTGFPVVSADGQLAGIITSLDLVALLIDRDSD